MSSSNKKQSTNNDLGDDELLFSYRQNKTTGRYSYKTSTASKTKPSSSNISEKKAAISPFNVALSSFYVRTTSAANTFAFLSDLNNDFASKIISDQILPHIQTNGRKVACEKEYEHSYVLEISKMIDISDSFIGIRQSLDSRNALGPMTLLNLTASFDVLIFDIIKIYLSKFPGIMDKSGKSFTLAELKKLNSIEEAETQLIEREVDSAMYESHIAQIEWLEEKLRKNVKELLRNTDRFAEIFERRNLCAHTSQIVNKRYNENCIKYGAKTTNLPKIGSKLTVSRAYINTAVPILLEYGLTIGQFVWRTINKSDKEELKLADELLLLQADKIINSGRLT